MVYGVAIHSKKKPCLALAILLQLQLQQLQETYSNSWDEGWLGWVEKT